LGPLLRAAFIAELQRRNIDADVALISHIGGHKYAGNVIMYLPLEWKTTKPDDGETQSPLAGTGIWYGRVGPENVEGIVDETVINGRVISGLCRGGIGPDGGDLGRLLETQLKKASGEEDQSVLRLKPRARGAV
jgi:leucyl-tRNA synthetase